jgi:ABC-2 type transport system permease protein
MLQVPAKLVTPWEAWWADATLYGRLIGARVRSQMQYRSSFLLMTLVSLLSTGSELIAIIIIFNHFGALAGWRVGEVALLYGLASVAFGLNEMVSAGFDVFPQMIQRGEFDRVMVRPVGAFTQVLASDFQLRRLGRIIQGIAALTLATLWTPIVWTPERLAFLMLVLVSGAVMFGALIVLGAVMCFWTVQSIEVINVLTYGGVEMASYPLPIYHELMLGLPAWSALAAPVAAATLAVIAWLAWQAGVRHYRSTGS